MFCMKLKQENKQLEDLRQTDPIHFNYWLKSKFSVTFSTYFMSVFLSFWQTVWSSLAHSYHPGDSRSVAGRADRMSNYDQKNSQKLQILFWDVKITTITLFLQTETTRFCLPHSSPRNWQNAALVCLETLKNFWVMASPTNMTAGIN